MKNYLKHVYDTDSWVGVKHKPLHNGLPATRTECGYKPEVKIDGQWWTTKEGTILDEDFSNGSLDGWTVINAVATIENGAVKIDDSANAGSFSSIRKNITLKKGYRYTVKRSILATSDSNDAGVFVGADITSDYSTYLSSIAIVKWSDQEETTTGTKEFTFVSPIDGVATFYLGTGGTSYSIVDNIQIFETDIEKDQPLPKQTYVHLEADLPIDKPVDVDRKDFPTLTEPYVATEKLEAKEVISKNQCTAWVNFDGTTTPPTIRDSFNVSDIVHISDGIDDVYFEEEMDRTDYSVSATGADNRCLSIDDYHQANFLHKVRVYSRSITSGAAINSGNNSVQVFGGKN